MTWQFEMARCPLPVKGGSPQGKQITPLGVTNEEDDEKCQASALDIAGTDSVLCCKVAPICQHVVS